MRKTRRIIPFVFCGLLISCTTERRLARVRISQPQMKETVADTGKQLPGQIAWTDDKGEEHLVKQVSHDSVTGENMTLIELSEVTVMAKSKQVAERNGKINLDFLVTVPGELINNKWQVQLTPVAYKPSDTLYLDKIFLSGADFAKMQEKGYMRYRAFYELHHTRQPVYAETARQQRIQEGTGRAGGGILPGLEARGHRQGALG